MGQLAPNDGWDTMRCVDDILTRMGVFNEIRSQAGFGLVKDGPGFLLVATLDQDSLGFTHTHPRLVLTHPPTRDGGLFAREQKQVACSWAWDLFGVRSTTSSLLRWVSKMTQRLEGLGSVSNPWEWRTRQHHLMMLAWHSAPREDKVLTGITASG